MSKNFIWGVDSATASIYSLPLFYNCLLSKFGKPVFWGRYLSEKSNVSEGLSKAEITFLHSENIKIMPIYNDFQSAVGIKEGKEVAIKTLKYVNIFDIPKDKLIFANLEHYFPINSEWLISWSRTLMKEGYKPGFYNDPIRGDFKRAFCEALRQDSSLKNIIVLWSRQPQPGTSSSSEAPLFKPDKPSCDANVLGWQYGIDTEVCSYDPKTKWLKVDTSLFDSKIFPYLW